MIKRRLISAALAYALTAYAAALIIFSEQTVSDMQTALARCKRDDTLAFRVHGDLRSHDTQRGVHIYIKAADSPRVDNRAAEAGDVPAADGKHRRLPRRHGGDMHDAGQRVHRQKKRSAADGLLLQRRACIFQRSGRAGGVRVS